MHIKRADFNDFQVRELIHIHLSGMQENTPREHIYALDLSALQQPHICVYTTWKETQILACGAIAELSPEHAEIKSMRTHPLQLRNGVATEILKYLIQIAKQRGYKKLSLETGTTENFQPAIQLYLKHGFKSGDAFGDYNASPFNQFFHLDL